MSDIIFVFKILYNVLSGKNGVKSTIVKLPHDNIYKNLDRLYSLNKGFWWGFKE